MPVRLPAHICVPRPQWVNILRPGQHGRHFTDDIFKCIFLNENVWTSIQISLKLVPKGPIDNIQALVQIMAWRRPGDKPLSEPMLIILLTHICVTRPQWVKYQIGECGYGMELRLSLSYCISILCVIVLWDIICYTLSQLLITRVQTGKAYMRKLSKNMVQLPNTKMRPTKVHLLRSQVPLRLPSPARNTGQSIRLLPAGELIFSKSTKTALGEWFDKCLVCFHCPWQARKRWPCQKTQVL